MKIPSLLLRQLYTFGSLENTADGTKYTLILEPQGTPLPTSTTGTATTPSAPTSTTPATTTPSVVPSSP